MSEEIHVKGADGSVVSICAGDTDCSGKYIEHERISLDQSKIIRHEAPSIGLTLPQVEITELVVALTKEGYGWNAVHMFVNPYVGSSTLYESHPDLGVNAPLSEHYDKAKGIYDNLLKFIKEGNFRIHLLHGGAMGIEELATS